MSNRFDELKRTHSKFYSEYRSWVKENSAKFPHGAINNSVFNMRTASDLLLEFSDTIDVVLSEKEQCIKYISESELYTIGVYLDQLLQAANAHEYNYFVEKMEEFISHMRPVQFLADEKASTTRYIEIRNIDETLLAIKTLEKSVTSTIKKVELDSKKLRNLIELITKKGEELEKDSNEKNNEFGRLFHEKNKKLSELINENNEKMKSLEVLHTDASDHAKRLNSYVSQIDNMLSRANEQKSKIDSFVNLIQEREEKITSQNEATEEYEEKLKDFAKKHELSMKEAERLIQEARNALKFSTASGLSEAFQTRQEKLEDRKVKRAWLFGGGFAVVGAVVVGIVIIFLGKDTTTANVVARSLIMVILIAAAIFCSRQYAKNRSYEEDYAYKAALVKSFPGLDEAFAQAGVRKAYADKLLEEVLQDPQRARHDKETLDEDHPLYIKLKRIFKKGETKTKNDEAEIDKPQQK